MDASSSKMPAQASLFQVYLRLRPALQNRTPKAADSEPWLLVETPPLPTTPVEEVTQVPAPTHITLQPPNNSRKRAVEKFGFTKVFQEEATQFDVFESTGIAQMVKNVLGNAGDGLVATLGVTGSGKSHTILGSRSQRGLTQMTLDVLFRSIGTRICAPGQSKGAKLLHSLQLSDPSEAQIVSAATFFESVYGDTDRGRNSRAQTPMARETFSRSQTPQLVGHPHSPLPVSYTTSPGYPYPQMASIPRESIMSFGADRFTKPSGDPVSTSTIRVLPPIAEPPRGSLLPSRLPFWNRARDSKKTLTKPKVRQDATPTPRRNPPARPSAFPCQPDVSIFATEVDQSADYVVLVSMYEVYNDRIFDLLSPTAQHSAGITTTRQGAALQKDLLRRPLLFKSTEMSPDRKVVAGLRKVACATYDEAVMLLEAGLAERRVAGTGSNAASSRSHGFFAIEVKRTNRFAPSQEGWAGSVLSIVDLAGSERARNAKTTGSTLAEAGKINESLMYLGQCLQVQSEHHDGAKPIVPFRQCKLTELLFSNSFSAGSSHAVQAQQKAIMIVTADPEGDFNATSQILRYSALAREVTVPRIPSVTTTILNGPHHPNKHKGRHISPSEQLFTAEELEQASSEIARLGEDCDQLALRLAEEEIKRSEAEFKLEAALQAAEERALLIEQEVRETCWSQMEAQMEAEKARWKRAKEEERARAEGYLDGKIEIVGKGVTIGVHEDCRPQVAEEIYRDNEVLRRKIEALERQLDLQSPTKTKALLAKKPLTAALKENNNPSSNPFLSAVRNSSDGASQYGPTNEEQLSPTKKMAFSRGTGAETDVTRRQVSVPKTPGTAKRMRKLTTRKWDFGDSGDEEGF